MPGFYSHHTCQPPFLDRAGLVSFPLTSKLVRPFPFVPPLPAAGEDVSFSSMDSARLRSHAKRA